MTEYRDVGGPAFPITPPTQYSGAAGVGFSYLHSSGMSLRDWFAGQALKAATNYTPISAADQLASWAYRVADAMLVERRKS